MDGFIEYITNIHFRSDLIMAIVYPICPYCGKETSITYSGNGSYPQKTPRNCESCKKTYIVIHGNGIVKTEKK